MIGTDSVYYFEYERDKKIGEYSIIDDEESSPQINDDECNASLLMLS